MERQNASGRRALRQKVNFAETDIPALSTAVETAMKEGGHKFKRLEVSRRGRELSFRVEVVLPDWVEKLNKEIVQQGDNGAFGGVGASTLPDGAVSSNGQALTAQEQALLKGLFSKLGLT